MGAMQRRKGASYEREVAGQLALNLGVKVQRELSQSRDGGCDLSRVGPFVIECKRRARISVYEWMEQVIAAAKEREVPIVVMRADGEESLVLLRLSDFMPLMAGELGENTNEGSTNETR